MQRNLARCLLAIFSIILIAAVCIGINKIRSASEAEKTLHALITTANALEDFLAKQKRWPTSWEELIEFSTPLPGAMYEFPRDSAVIRERMKVRFDISLDQLENPRNEMLVEPIGPCFEYERRLDLLYKQIERTKLLN